MEKLSTLAQAAIKKGETALNRADEAKKTDKKGERVEHNHNYVATGIWTRESDTDDERRCSVKCENNED